MRWGRNWNEGERTTMVPAGSLQREINTVFDDFLTGWGLDRWPKVSESGGFVPKINIAEDQAEFRITAELPGVKKDDVKINISGNLLTLSGEKRSEVERGEEGKTRYVERSYGSFQRGFTLNTEVDEDKIDASFADGILTISLPKSKKAQEKYKSISIR